jgi:DNA polymerase IV
VNERRSERPGPKRTILHADLDAFYASVEVLDDPSLRGLPVIVGGARGERGVVSAASYEARTFGVHSAMPIRTAERLCPSGVFLPGHPDRYRELSDQVMAIFRSYTPLVEPISLDEAFMDVTGSAVAFGDGESIARQIKSRVLGEAGLVVSVGVASNKLCAKVASDLRKPDALVVVSPGEEAAFLAPLPVSRLWGAGPKAQQALRDFGVQRIGDLAALSPATLERRFGQHGGELARRAQGIDPSAVVPSQAPKSIGHEHTFEHDVVDPRHLESTLLDLAESVASRLRRHHMAAGAVQLKLRYEGFETLTRQAPLPHQTRDGEVLYTAGIELLRRTLVRERAVRLVGLTAINLADAQQLTLFDGVEREERLSASIDAVRERFGENAITRARLLRDRPRRRFDFGERPDKAGPRPESDGLDE